MRHDLRAADVAERWLDDTLGRAALSLGGDVATVARSLAAEIDTTPAELVTGHVLRLEHYLRQQGAWTQPDTIDAAAFEAVALEVQAHVLRSLWPIAAACGWRPAPAVPVQ